MQPFIGKKLLFLVAHPDDETFTAAGTMYENHLHGGENYIICATSGERGKSHITRPITFKELSQMREKELKAAAKYLKVKGLYFLHFPDTKLNQKTEQLAVKSEELIRKIKPDYIISFGPDGMSGHLDHIAAGQVAKALAKKLKLPFLAFGASPALRQRFGKVKKRRRYGKYAKSVRHALPNVKIKIDLKHKAKAFSFHKSQFGPSTIFVNMPKSVQKSFMDYEYFVK